MFKTVTVAIAFFFWGLYFGNIFTVSMLMIFSIIATMLAFYFLSLENGLNDRKKVTVYAIILGSFFLGEFFKYPVGVKDLNDFLNYIYPIIFRK